MGHLASKSTLQEVVRGLTRLKNSNPTGIQLAALVDSPNWFYMGLA